MPICLYCKSIEGSFKSIEHVFPESLGNQTIMLQKGVVCDSCNNGVLSQLDQALLEFSPISFMRVNYSIPSKSGTLPQVKFGNVHLKCINPGQIEIKTFSPRVIFENEGRFNIKTQSNKRLTNDYLKKITRELFKIALGLIYIDHGAEFALSERYDSVRRIILGQDDFHGYLLFENKATPKKEVKFEYYLPEFKNGEKTTFLIANFFGIKIVTDLEIREARHPELFPEDQYSLLTF